MLGTDTGGAPDAVAAVERPGRSANAPIGVLVVDDHQVFSEALSMAIDARDGMRCTGVALTHDDAVRMAGETRPDVVVMDVGFEDSDGLETTAVLRERDPGLLVLVLTGQPPRAQLVQAASDAGASGFMVKTSALGTVLDAIAAISNSYFALDRRSLDALCAPPADADSRGGRLTGRERDILDFLSEGVDLQAAATRLGISVNTARGYVKNLHRKLGVRNQVELLAAARERGLLDR
jgi:DNA-binding NarL/FixJ family response regulator